MSRRLISSVFQRTAYVTDAMVCRNVSKWWSRRCGWVVGSLIRDELFTLRCMRSLEGGVA